MSLAKVKTSSLVLFLAFSACGKEYSSESNGNKNSQVDQLGSMLPTQLKEKWTCSMLAYDFDKYFPKYNQLLEILKTQNALAADFPTQKFVTDMDISTAIIVAPPPVNMGSTDLHVSDFKYAADMAFHLNNIKSKWISSCSRTFLKKDKEIIWDTPACISPCLPYLPGCYTCSSTPEGFLKTGAGTITCGSKYDSLAAVTEFCANNKLENCRPTCKFIPGKETRIRFKGGGISGTFATDTYTHSDTFVGSVKIGGGITSPVVKAELSATASGTIDFTNQIKVNSALPHLYQEVVLDPNDPSSIRTEFTSGTNYFCTIALGKIRSLALGASISLGLSGNWMGLGASFTTTFSGSAADVNNTNNSYTRYGINTDGKTLEDVKLECANWTKKALQVYAIIRPTPHVPFTFPGKGISCRYANGDVKELKEIAIIFNEDDSGSISYKVPGVLGVKKVLTYSIHEKMDQYKNSVLSISDESNKIALESKNALLAEMLNKLVKNPSQAEKKKWNIDTCFNSLNLN